MKDSYKIKANQNLLHREIAGEHLLIPVREIAMKVHGMINLTESGLLLWSRLQEACVEDDLVACILKEYDVDKETATKDVRDFIAKMDKIGILEHVEN